MMMMKFFFKTLILNLNLLSLVKVISLYFKKGGYTRQRTKQVSQNC